MLSLKPREDAGCGGPVSCRIQGSSDPLISKLQGVIRLAVRILAVLMTFVILWGILDVVWVLFQRLTTEPYLLLDINDILATFGAFIAVLIAVEIFANIVVYLEDNVIHVKLVLATALMAAARKVIVLDFKALAPHYIWSIGVVILGLGVTYWLVTRHPKRPGQDAEEEDQEE